jgi:hypothetical protein
VIVALPIQLRDEVLAYLNGRPRGEVNGLCCALESLPEVELEEEFSPNPSVTEPAVAHITLGAAEVRRG